MAKEYSLEQVREIYGLWGRSAFFYKMGTWSFGFETKMRRRAISLLELKQGNTVIDLACGPGVSLNDLQRFVGSQGTIIAVDYVPEMIEQARKLSERKGWRNVKLKVQDAARLDVGVEVDAILCTLGMSAIPDHMGALRACKKALKKGGRLVIVDGKDSDVKWLNPLLHLMRWKKTYQRKDLASDIKMIFPGTTFESHAIGSTFISVARK